MKDMSFKQKNIEPVEKTEKEIIHTPMGTTTATPKFVIGDRVFVAENALIENPNLNKDAEMIVVQILSDSKYIVGYEGMTLTVDAKDMKKSK